MCRSHSLFLCMFVCEFFMYFHGFLCYKNYMLECYKIVCISINMKFPHYTKLFNSINLPEESSSFPISLSSSPLSLLHELSQRID